VIDFNAASKNNRSDVKCETLTTSFQNLSVPTYFQTEDWGLRTVVEEEEEDGVAHSHCDEFAALGKRAGIAAPFSSNTQAGHNKKTAAAAARYVPSHGYTQQDAS
jgi:hypothetical protein